MTTRPRELTGQRVSNCFPIIRPTVRPKCAGKRTHFSPFSRNKRKVLEVKKKKGAINISRKMHGPMLNATDTIDEDQCQELPSDSRTLPTAGKCLSSGEIFLCRETRMLSMTYRPVSQSMLRDKRYRRTE
ncbi:hypothetical protein CEXT_673611 [Caerostris extrusa]|uniref:Uncharacterized protein n=1 Tax=Caerostris extrusa TaxID=172846 RepID=A0AAV4VWT0_CAEEX|nr:hypothetical protein CEXT_673611 [Caerostris extrusa]